MPINIKSNPKTKDRKVVANETKTLVDESNFPQPRKMKLPTAVPDETIAEALRKNRGLAYLAAQSIGLNSGHVCTRIKESPYLQAVRDSCVELRIDVAEQKLSELIEDKNVTGLIFFLKTRAKQRGYVETQEIQIPPEVGEQMDRMLDQLKSLQDKAKQD